MYRAGQFVNNSILGIWLLIFSLLLPSLTSCKKSTIPDHLSEGTIEYEIQYTNNSGRNFPIQLLPKIMHFSFNADYEAYSIEDRVGLFSIRIIADLKSNQQFTMVKVFDKKYVYKNSANETPVFFKTGTHYKIHSKADTLRMEGLLCYKISLLDPSSDSTFQIIYTPVEIPSPNKNTPYSDVKGILLTFNLQMKSLGMKLAAKKIESKEVNEKDFEIPTSYRFISKNKMEEIISTLLP